MAKQGLWAPDYKKVPTLTIPPAVTMSEAKRVARDIQSCCKSYPDREMAGHNNQMAYRL